MKILFYLGSVQHSGGPQLNAIEVSSILTESGHEVFLAALNRGFSREQLGIITDRGINLITPPRLFSKKANILSKLFLSVQLLLKFSLAPADRVLAIGRGRLHYLLLLLKSKHGIFIHRETGSGAGPEREWLLYKKYIRKVDRIAVLSKCSYDKILDSWNPRCQVIIIPEMTPRLLSETFSTRPIPKLTNQICFGYFGRLEVEKGITALIRRWADLPSNWLLRVYGFGSEEANIHRLLSSGSVSANVSLMGAYERNDLPSAFHNIDCLLLPTLDDTEGVPTVLIEAALQGVPSIVTDAGCTEAVGKRIDNIYYSGRSIEEFIKVLRSVGADLSVQGFDPLFIREQALRSYGYNHLKSSWMTLITAAGD